MTVQAGLCLTCWKPKLNCWFSHAKANMRNRTNHNSTTSLERSLAEGGMSERMQNSINPDDSTTGYILNKKRNATIGHQRFLS